MATRPAPCVLHHLRCAALHHHEAPLSDAQLLERYLTCGDDLAFASLVRRHGSMVLGVCRRILHNEADAEDAFQATFLVFVLKAASIRARALLGNWLYGVAYNTARKAKAMIRTRRAKEQQALSAPKESPDELAVHEVQALLDAELAALPETYRAAVVLCDLEGKTIKEAAAQLGWPQGTAASRLRRGRALLAKRLSERGLTWSAGALTTATVPAALLSSTVQAATLVAAGQTVTSGLVSAHIAALVQGVLQAMFVSKFKTVSVVFAVVFLGLSGSLFSHLGGGGSVLPSLAAAQASADDSLKATLLALDKHLWEASARGDWQERQKFLADDFVSLSILGKHGKAEAVAADKRLRCSEWSIRDAEVAKVSKDVAVLCYLYSCKILSSDGELLETRKDHRVNYVWANRKGGWVIVYCHDDHGRRVPGPLTSLQSHDRVLTQKFLGRDVRVFDLWVEKLALASAAHLPVGEWSVEFTNGVTESTTIAMDGTATVAEKTRKAQGHARVVGDAVVVTYADDRVERWKPAGKRMIVEHWFPASEFPSGKPVLGVAERREEAKLEIVRLQHVAASEAAKILAAMGGTGRVTTDDRTNSLLTYGSPEQLAKYKAKLREIDVPKR